MLKINFNYFIIFYNKYWFLSDVKVLRRKLIELILIKHLYLISKIQSQICNRGFLNILREISFLPLCDSLTNLNEQAQLPIQ